MIEELQQIRNAVKGRMLGKAVQLLDELIIKEKDMEDIFESEGAAMDLMEIQEKFKDYTKPIAQHHIAAFDMSYDKQTVADIEDLRERSVDPKSEDRIRKYDKGLAEVKYLKEKFNL